MVSKPKVLLNVDTGVDDALAILLALRSPEIEVVGIAVTAGNVSVYQAAYNTRVVLNVAHRTEVPVVSGASRPLKRSLTTATLYHGADGLAGLSSIADDPGGTSQDVVEFLTQMADEHGEDLTVVSTGPLTNLAMAIANDHEWATKVNKIVIMGGAISVPGNVTPCAEFNIWSDPEAAQIVVESRGSIVLVGLDVIEKALIFSEQIEAWRMLIARSPIDTDKVPAFAYHLVEFLAKASEPGVGIPLYDPLALAVAVDPELVTTMPMLVQVETHGELTRGQTIGTLSVTRPLIVDLGDHSDIVGTVPVTPNMLVAVDVAADRFVGAFARQMFGAEN